MIREFLGRIHRFFRGSEIKLCQREIRQRARRCGLNLHVNGLSNVNRNTILGDGVNFNGMTIIGDGPVSIGNNFHSGQDCIIITNNHNYDYGDAIPYDSKESIPKAVIIEDNVWVGAGVIILPGAFIGEGAIIQAGAVVSGKIQSGGIAGGVPAKIFKFRDMNHYEKLKAEHKYY